MRRCFRFLVDSVGGGLVPVLAVLGRRVVALVPIGGRSLYRLVVFGRFAKIGHQRHGLGDVHRVGPEGRVVAVQIARCWRALLSHVAEPLRECRQGYATTLLISVTWP